MAKRKKLILLIDIDSKIPNLALHKLAKYHQDRGDNVVWDIHLLRSSADKIYASCVFDWNKKRCDRWEGKAEIGGSGYSLTTNLPEEIENIKPRINLGFTMRGCPRSCDFCIVPRKEGGPKIVGDLLDLWDGKSKDIVIIDNNALAAPEQFIKVCAQARVNKIRIDFNQGLDHRLLTPELAKILKLTPLKEYRFAFDHPSYLPTVTKALGILKAANIKKSCFWYVLVGFNTTPKEDVERLNFLRSQGQLAYVQRFNFSKKDEFIPLARWASAHMLFAQMTFEQFLCRPENLKYRRWWLRELE